jgi:hypothetical protein
VALDSNLKGLIIKKGSIARASAGLPHIMGTIFLPKQKNERYSNSNGKTSLLVYAGSCKGLRNAESAGGNHLDRNVPKDAVKNIAADMIANSIHRVAIKIYFAAINALKNLNQDMEIRADGFAHVDVALLFAVGRESASVERANGERNTSMIDLPTGKYLNAMGTVA